MKNNARNNGKQRRERKLPGGITDKGFQQGQSGNPNGRPRTHGLVNALRIAIVQELRDGRTVEEAIAEALIEEALHGKHRVAAINAIYDRIEGKPRQPITLDEEREREQDEVARMTDAELAEELRKSYERALRNVQEKASDAP
jgi:hypothetical protein